MMFTDALLFSFLVLLADASKILMLPYGMYSHVNMNAKLGKALKDDGHEVWILGFDIYEDTMKKNGLVPLTFPLKKEDDLWTKFDEWGAESPDGSGVYEKWLADEWWLMSNGRICDFIMQDERIQRTILEQKFDLVVLDGVDEVICHLMIPYKFDIPFVTLHAFQVTPWVAGVTGMPSVEPEMDKSLSNRMNFWERLDNLYSFLDKYNDFYYALYNDHMDKYCPKHKPKIPLKTVAEKSEMYLMNYEIMCLDYPRLSAPNMHFLGPSSATAAKPLPADLEEFVSGAEHGVVLMTLGSMMGAQMIWKLVGDKLFNAFSKLPQRVLVQYRLDEIYGTVPPNVKLMKWLPQNDILGHKNVKLFIMHGGNNGQNEAVYHGVPMLVVPIYFDQNYNGKRIREHAYGDYVEDKHKITADELAAMMSEIINNKTYAKNIKKCSGIIRSLPSAQEKFVFWVNHILKFGGAHLRPPSLDMPLYQVLMIDVVAYFIIYYLVIVNVVIFVIYFVLKYLLRYLKNRKFKSD